ncbi:MAG: hydrolase [Anaerolineaceae bacterium]|nr:hydrolase [Anaerolineaceae bacterium]
MGYSFPSRDEAWNILTKYVTTEHLQRHVLMVEGAMRHFAKLYGEDPEEWGILGMLHDIDFELFPDEHLQHAPRILREEGFDEQFIHSVVSHGYGICSDVEPASTAEKVLFTVDELTGLIYACALMRPSKSVMDLELKSVKKKFKSPAFAANVNRQVILDGAERLGMPIDEVIQETILALRECANNVGLVGTYQN